MSDYEKNSEIARRLRTELMWEGRHFRKGEYVALLDGRVIAVGSSPDDAIAELRRQSPDAARGMVVELSPDQLDVIR